MNVGFNRVYYRDYQQLQDENKRLVEKDFSNEQEIKRLQCVYEIERKEKERLQSKVAEQEKQIEALKREVARLNGIVNLDGTNSGTPTSKTPISKKKIIPNTRKATEKRRGGQPGHPKAKMKAFSESEITEDAIHGFSECPECGGELALIGEKCKDELDYEVVVIKRRHHFQTYRCKACGKEITHPIPNHLKEDNQYGIHTQALALSLMNIGNVSMNKVKRVICGLSEGDVYPTEGYIAKLQKRAALALESFKAELVKNCISQKVVYWDDTVIFIDAKRACLRFYGNERIAVYFAHSQKNKKGIDDDRILPLLPEDTTVMHDHLKVNYNDDYSFQNVECNQHLLRDLQKVTDNLKREWSENLKRHIQGTIHDRNSAQERGETAFSFEYVDSFMRKFDQIMIQGNLEHDNHPASYYYQQEAALLTRIMEYKNNYFAWVTCFELPVTNNLSERSLRGVKTHLKVSGQFQSEEYAQYYATIMSYIETCRRNGINEMSALLRLCEGNPYTVDEIMNVSGAA